MGVDYVFEGGGGVVAPGVGRGEEGVALVVQGVGRGGTAEGEGGVDGGDEAGDGRVPGGFGVGGAQGAEAAEGRGGVCDYVVGAEADDATWGGWVSIWGLLGRGRRRGKGKGGNTVFFILRGHPFVETAAEAPGEEKVVAADGVGEGARDVAEVDVPDVDLAGEPQYAKNGRESGCCAGPVREQRVGCYLEDSHGGL